MTANRHINWLQQAEKDLTWAKDSLRCGHFAQACFISQQVAEKAMKALALFRGVTEIRGHSITKIASVLGENGEFSAAGRKLDLFYISTRYPDAVPEGIP